MKTAKCFLQWVEWRRYQEDITGQQVGSGWSEEEEEEEERQC